MFHADSLSDEGVRPTNGITTEGVREWKCRIGRCIMCDSVQCYTLNDRDCEHDTPVVFDAVRARRELLEYRCRRGIEAAETAHCSLELFNIADDPNEKVNLAESHPDKVEQLLARLAHYRKEAVPPRGLNDNEPAGYKAPKVWGEAE